MNGRQDPRGEQEDLFLRLAESRVRMVSRRSTLRRRMELELQWLSTGLT